VSYLREDIAAVWADQDPMNAAFALTGEVFRDMPGRRTLKVDLNGRDYFVKLHFGVGWREVIKNWLQFKWPVVGAENEFRACRGLAEAGIPAPQPAAYASSQGSIAQRRSFVLCDALTGYTSLEDVTDTWFDAPPSALLRQRVLYAVARFARDFHAQGFIHRDFYICHLLARDDALREGVVELAVLDLHRARRFARVPGRWRKRDLAALLFSSLDLGYSPRQWLRFVRIYTGQPLRQSFGNRRWFWRRILRRAERLYEEKRRKGKSRGLYRP
jgi:heptose I phosphotransferase